MARAEWHFGGGASYCDGCARQGRPCARVEPGADGGLCPYIANEPITDAGWQAWDVLLRCSGQLRILAGAVVGLDLAAARQLGEALGHDRRTLPELLPAGEVGMSLSFAQKTAGSSA